jgi:hypothetical protein
MSTDKRTKYRLDIIIVLSVVVIGIVMLLALVFTQKSGEYVIVKMDGAEIARFELYSDTEYEIKGDHGERNLLVIKDGKAEIKEASCPDGLCIKTGKIDKEGQSIVCLPNKVVVEISGEGQDNDVDIIAG